MLKKILLIILTILSFSLLVHAYSPYIPKGTLVKVYTKIPISTETLQEGSTVYFMVPSDVWVIEEKAIEQGDMFKGYVSMLKLPVQGVNGAMKIAITDLVKKDGSIHPVKGRIIFYNKDVLGGDLTAPASYNKMLHLKRTYKNYWGGALQYVPSGEYEMGHHSAINMKDFTFVQFDEDYYF